MSLGVQILFSYIVQIDFVFLNRNYLWPVSIGSLLGDIPLEVIYLGHNNAGVSGTPKRLFTRSMRSTQNVCWGECSTTAWFIAGHLVILSSQGLLNE